MRENAMKAILQATKPATRVSVGLPLASSPFSGVKALNGCTDAKWEGFCNGNGTDVGRDIDALIGAAQNSRNSNEIILYRGRHKTH